MSLADSDFEAVGFDDAFQEVPAEQAPEVARPQAAYRKRDFDVYSFFLILSFLMLILAIIFLFIEVSRFE